MDGIFIYSFLLKWYRSAETILSTIYHIYIYICVYIHLYWYSSCYVVGNFIRQYILALWQLWITFFIFFSSNRVKNSRKFLSNSFTSISFHFSFSTRSYLSTSFSIHVHMSVYTYMMYIYNISIFFCASTSTSSSFSSTLLSHILVRSVQWDGGISFGFFPYKKSNNISVYIYNHRFYSFVFLSFRTIKSKQKRLCSKFKSHIYTSLFSSSTIIILTLRVRNISLEKNSSINFFIYYICI